VEIVGSGRRRTKRKSRKGPHPTIVDVAKAAGVSKTTVSNVMHRSGRFTPETEIQVLDAIHQLGFRPNVLARQLVQQKTTTVGVVVGALDNPFYAEMAMQIEREAASHGFHAMFCNTQGDEGAELWGLESYLDYRAAGILFAWHPPEWTRARSLVDGRIPTVFVTCDSEWGDVVRSDDENGGRLATQHLVQLGHERIAYFADPVDDAANRDRRRGYLSTMRAARLRPIVVEWDRREVGVRDTKLEEAVRRGVTAIFATDDYGAIELLESADRLGIPVPRQLSVVGFDDLIMSGLGRIGLTTVQQPKHRLANVAMSALLERIKAGVGAPRVRHVVPVELAVRNSTSRPPGTLT
jgi:LacI family transcriptional regulator